MTKEQGEQQLISAGYAKVTIHHDPPNFRYEEHDHPVDTAYMVFEGEMKVWFDGKEYPVAVGQCLYIGKKVAHSALMGEEGCTFLVGVRI